MLELIFFVIFIISFGGVLLILARKIPVLSTLPRNGASGIKKHRIILDAEDKIKDILVSFKKQILLHKFLSWVKCMTLKAEVEIDHILHSIRRKAQQVDKDIKNQK
ncbi:MAG: hypothetical protein A3G45_00950 [Candidatus Staskawiczbacteria bacterium RIFCSPLOWO2_12_FULL_37_15]|uniref:Uncharacterized protein n=1 Tax=Candidatus Staskawiczbacteria bacterium RIFCSPLOWO2_12_FULL_37_15 TaxID=1802218 RepID=A0A1G2IKD9_9BACT|nr:MAG: hypothetical protein US35_C0002G0009 [Parcubacteria group bacterium GW2011_GWA2_37_10]OGZ75324.1 MAG: hypothetical protein A3G45_00950 [Candidatus Staskawiczbacteria bacterium RIFCSPLOWO2_12_FULL_37_15]